MIPGPSPRRRAFPRLPLAAAGALAVASCAAPAPPETAAPAPTPAGERAYIVFFEWGSSRIGPRGRRIVAEAARNAGAEQGSGGRVELQAYADRSGRSSRNQSLSERRAEAVAAELARQGVRRERIAVQAHGEGGSFVPTRDGEKEAQNRGVWIVLR